MFVDISNLQIVLFILGELSVNSTVFAIIHSSLTLEMGLVQNNFKTHGDKDATPN